MMKEKIIADECDVALELTFFLTSLVNIYLPVLFYFLHFFVIKLLKKGIQIDENLLWGIEALKL